MIYLLVIGYFIVVQLDLNILVIKPLDLIILFSFIFILVIIMKTNKLFFPKEYLILISMYPFIMISILLNTNNKSIIDSIQFIELYLVLPFVLYYLLRILYIDKKENIFNLFLFIIGFIIFEAVLFYFPEYNMTATFRGRHWGTMTTGNYPYILVVGVIFILGLIKKGNYNFIQKIILFFILIFISVTIILEDSKASLLGLILSFPLFLFNYVFNSKQIFKLIIFSLLVLLLIVNIVPYINMQSNFVLRNINHIFINPLNLAEGIHRFGANIGTILMWKDHIFFGVGLGNTGELLKDYVPERYKTYRDIKINYTDRMTSHNFWLEFFSETGFFTTVLFIIFNLIIMKEAYFNFLYSNKKSKISRILNFCFYHGFIILSIMYSVVHSPGYHMKTESVFIYMFFVVNIIVISKERKLNRVNSMTYNVH